MSSDASKERVPSRRVVVAFFDATLVVGEGTTPARAVAARRTSEGGMQAFVSADDPDAAHERMVALRIDIAERVALERAERDLRLEAASAATTTTAGFRGGDDAPATPATAGGRARRPEAHVSARIPPGPAREQLKLQWVRLFHLAERFPSAAVTSRLAAVHALHDKTQAAIVAHCAAEEHAAVLRDALDALVAADHRAPDETNPTSDTSDNDDNDDVAAFPSSTNRVVAGGSREVIAAEVRARDTKLAAFELNAALSCLVEAVNCEARAEVQMACAENGAQRLGWSPVAASGTKRPAATTAPRASPASAQAKCRTAKRAKVYHPTAAGAPSGVGEKRRPGRPKGSKNKPKPKPALGVVEGMRKAAEEKTRMALAGTTTTPESAERTR